MEGSQFHTSKRKCGRLNPKAPETPKLAPENHKMWNSTFPNSKGGREAKSKPTASQKLSEPRLVPKYNPPLEPRCKAGGCYFISYLRICDHEQQVVHATTLLCFPLLDLGQVVSAK